jgi:hypothetical protein
LYSNQHRVYDGSGEVARTQGVWGAEGISGRVKFLPLAWAGMPKTSFRKNSDSPLALRHTRVDFAQKLQEIIDQYNAGGSSTENYFADLMKFTRGMQDEDERHIRVP